MPIIVPPIAQPIRQGVLLDLVQDVCAELSLQIPSTVVGNQSDMTRQMLALANKLGRDLTREMDWQELIRTVDLTVSPGSNSYQLPSDWARQIPGTEWTKGQRWPAIGPMTPHQWMTWKVSYIHSGIEARFRIENNRIVFFANPSVSDTFQFQYISKNWVLPSTGSTGEKFVADQDGYVFPVDLMTEGLKMLWRKAKGLTYDEMGYRDILDRCKAQNQSAPYLNAAPIRAGYLLTNMNIPDGNWPA